MQYPFTLTLLIFLFTSCQNHDPDSKRANESVNPKYAEFKIDFPKNNFELRKRVSPSPNHTGNTINDWILEGKEGDASFVYFLTQDYIDASITKLSISSNTGKEAFLSGLLSSSISKFNPSNVTYKTGTYEKLNMVEARGEIIGDKQIGLVKYRAFTNGLDFFLIGVAGQNYNDSIADKFLNSFEIIN